VALIRPPASNINLSLELVSGTTTEPEREPALQALKKLIQRR